MDKFLSKPIVHEVYNYVATDEFISDIITAGNMEVLSYVRKLIKSHHIVVATEAGHNAKTKSPLLSVINHIYAQNIYVSPVDILKSLSIAVSSNHDNDFYHVTSYSLTSLFIRCNDLLPVMCIILEKRYYELIRPVLLYMLLLTPGDFNAPECILAEAILMTYKTHPPLKKIVKWAFNGILRAPTPDEFKLRIRERLSVMPEGVRAFWTERMKWP